MAKFVRVKEKKSHSEKKDKVRGKERKRKRKPHLPFVYRYKCAKRVIRGQKSTVRTVLEETTREREREREKESESESDLQPVKE